jgi:YidC/Oxa1 family membrane protein insertase
MPLTDILYTVIIFPLVQVIDFAYTVTYRLFDNVGIAIGGVGLAVSVITLPLYFMAEKQAAIERETEKKLKPEVDNIKTVFRGDKRYMILSTFYRQNHYHPIYALRSSLSLAIQIPFFIAAYRFLSVLPDLQGEPFLFIKNLGVPDALFILPFGKTGDRTGFTINFLPILMTLINCAAGFIYTSGLPLKEKVQLYGMAFLFLVLLYNAPAGLVLYWTVNNLFSLVKNLMQKTKYLPKIVLYGLYILAAAFTAYLLLFHPGALKKRLILAAVICAALFIPLLKKALEKAVKKIKSLTSLGETALERKRTFVVSVGTICLLAGLVIPSSIISSSVTEFSFIEDYTSPLLFIANALLQAAGFFCWFLGIYFLFNKKIRRFFTLFMTLLCGMVMVNTFLFGGNYGFLDAMLKISDTSGLKNTMLISNFSVICAVSVILTVLLLFRKKAFVYTLQSIVFASLLVLGSVFLFKINREFSSLDKRMVVHSYIVYPQTEYTFSKMGKNVLLIMLDRAISGYVPYLFEEKPHLYEDFDGFTYYPNCISFNGFTLMGAPGIYGGYEYTPLEMQKQNGKRLVDKHNEALLMLPRLFLDNGYDVTVASPPYANYQWYPDVSIFDSYPDIRTNTLMEDEKYVGYWKDRYKYEAFPLKALLRNNLIRFSLFKFVPPVFRSIAYDDGLYLTEVKFNGESKLPPPTLQAYIDLDILPEVTGVKDGDKNTYTAIYNTLPHEPVFFQIPEYTPFETVTDKGSGLFANEDHYHVNMASFLLLAKWFNYLKANGVYDNTRIIIVSDHGRRIGSSFSDNITLPDGSIVQEYAALLMVKDFSESGKLKTDRSFMTNADVPLIATQGVLEKPVNPFTQKPLESDKSNGITLTTSYKWEFVKHGIYKFHINKDEWLHVHDNIFDPANWERVEVEP